MVQGIVLKNNDILLTSNIEKIVPDDYNDPDLELTVPYVVQLVKLTNGLILKPFLGDYTNQKVFSLRSEDVLTMFTPNEYLIEEYKKLTGVEEQLELSVGEEEN